MLTDNIPLPTQHKKQLAPKFYFAIPIQFLFLATNRDAELSHIFGAKEAKMNKGYLLACYLKFENDVFIWFFVEMCPRPEK